MEFFFIITAKNAIRTTFFMVRMHVRNEQQNPGSGRRADGSQVKIVRRISAAGPEKSGAQNTGGRRGKLQFKGVSRPARHAQEASIEFGVWASVRAA